MNEHSTENGLLIPSNWNPHWNYRLGGEPRSVCACPDGPYEGARLATIPRYCERCGGLVTSAALPSPKPDPDLAGTLDGRAIVAAINALTEALARVIPPADRHEPVGEPGAGEGS